MKLFVKMPGCEVFHDMLNLVDMLEMNDGNQSTEGSESGQ